MKELKGRFTQGLQKIKESITPKPEQKHIEGNRLGEDVSDVTLSSDYKRVGSEDKSAEPLDVKITTPDEVGAVLRNHR